MSPSRALLALVALTAAVASGCREDVDADGDALEPIDSALSEPGLDLPDETAPADALAAAPDDAAGTDLLDVRGVGDTAFARTHENDPMPARLGDALDRFDPSGKLLKGDLTFMNWESVIGERCDRFSKPYVAGESYAFVSRAENLAQAYARGVNLIGLSNNHSRDCSNGGGEETSSRMSVPALEAMAGNDWLYAGMTLSNADKRKAAVRTFELKGRRVRVAFASIYTGRASCPLATCQADTETVLESLRDAPADLRILALHSQSSQPALVKTGTDFITRYDGDVVFGHGPHVWKPVHVLRKANGKAGVFFESLGNFLHPGCAAQSRNVIGRALFDDALELKQVQVLPVKNSGLDVKLSTVSGAELGANVRWTSTGRGRGVYANIKP
jgi:poly-gamma-glutamate synthesis protein (capsule biosynthesis protein)